MAGVNKVIIVGRLGQAPNVTTMNNGEGVATLSIATSESWTDKRSGDKVERTEWHRVVLYRRLAEVAGEYLRKGAQVYIEGKLQTRQWKDKDGIERYTTEIIADKMQMIGSAPDKEKNATAAKTAKADDKTNYDEYGYENPPF